MLKINISFYPENQKQLIKLSYIPFLLLFFLQSAFFSLGQDVQFTQYYAAQPLLNPAFAGSAHHFRGMVHNRLQWPGLGAHYTTVMAGADHYFDKYRSGGGIYVMHDMQGTGDISSTSVQAQYSYEIFVTNDLIVRPGLQLGFVSEAMDYSNLRFPSQFNNDGLHTDVHGYENVRTSYADISSGALVYNQNFWFGYSMHHMNTPNQSVLGLESELPARHTFVGGYKINLGKTKRPGSFNKEEVSITPTVHYRTQGKSDQFDVGVYGIYHQLISGIWYRGIPPKKFLPDLQNNESMAVILGWKYNQYKITYSYDFVLSKLTNARSGGSHELNITFTNIFVHKKRKPMKRIPCPDLFSL